MSLSHVGPKCIDGGHYRKYVLRHKPSLGEFGVIMESLDRKSFNHAPLSNGNACYREISLKLIDLLNTQGKKLAKACLSSINLNFVE